MLKTSTGAKFRHINKQQSSLREYRKLEKTFKIMHKEVIFLNLAAWFITKFEPIQMPIMHIFKASNLVAYWIRSLLTCWFCLSLWLTFASLIYMGENWKDAVFYALINSFAAWFISDKTGKK